MSFRAIVTAASITALAASTLTAAATAAQPPGWTPPTAIPGTAQRTAPWAATAPDGGDLVLWRVPGTTASDRSVKARLRPPGSTTWVRLPRPMVDKPYGSPAAIAPTRGGDFWVVFRWYTKADFPEVYLSKLDTSARRWTKPKRVFRDPGLGHSEPGIAVTNDGTIYVAARAIPHTPTAPLTSRVEVATKERGSGWDTRFLSPADKQSFAMGVFANPRGQVAVPFIQGRTLAAKRVRVATKGSRGKSTWKVADVSTVGDAQRAYGAIGPDGTVAVAWNAPSTSADTVRLATFRIGAPGGWDVTDAVTGGGTNRAAAPVVAPDGSVTALWETVNAPNSLLYARELAGGTWGAATPFSTAGMQGTLESAQPRPDGTVAAVYHQFSAGPANEGLRFRVIDHGVPGSEAVLTDAGDGSANSVWLGVDAAAGNHLLWTRGDFPDTDFVTMGDPGGQPVAMTKAYVGLLASKATIVGKMRVGNRVSCGGLYWVQAKSVTYRWYRDGSPIRHQTGKRYLLKAADEGRMVSCRAKAEGLGGRSVLDSSGRKVR